MKKWVMFLFVIVFLSLVSANFDVGNSSDALETSYAPDTTIRGWINISFEDEPVDSLFEDSEGNSVNLFDLLEANSDYDYDCTTVDCGIDYSASNGELTKSESVSGGDSLIFGFEFSEPIMDITAVNFTIESDADSSCTNQLEVDVLADGIVETGNYKIGSSSCSYLKNYGCFDEVLGNQNYGVGTGNNMHCQRITLSESPGFMLGAWVKQEIGSKNLQMALYDLNLELVEGTTCDLGNDVGEGEISCDIDYLVTDSQDYYVCIFAEEQDDVSKIRGYMDSSNGCGFYYTGTANENFAYQIFAEGKRFDSVGILKIGNEFDSSASSFSEMIKDYIIEKYDGLECSQTKKCVVPILINSGKTQQIDLKDLSIKYTGLGGPTELTKFYDLSQTPSKVSSDFQGLYLDAGNFSVPDEYGDFTFELSLEGDEVISKDVVVEKVPSIIKVVPTSTISAFPTPFEVTVNSSAANITQYLWEFGDGINTTTSTNKVSHTYNSTGTYDLTITITDSLDLSSKKTFSIKVGSPETVINTTIEKMQADLAYVKSQISNLSGFSKTEVGRILDIDGMDNELKSIQMDYTGASSNAEYNQVMSSLLALKVPESISQSARSGAISFYPSEDVVNLDILKTVGGGDYSSNSGYFDAILSWNQENLDTKVSFDEFSAEYGGVLEPILRIFKVDVTEKKSLSRDPYFILENLDDLSFEKNYLEEEDDGYTYITLTSSPTSIRFSTTEDVSFSTLPLFISPSLNELSVLNICEGDSCEPEPDNRWMIFVLVMVFILILAAIVYVILQEWYKKKYENHLFKNSNNLYNLIHYVENEKRKGVSEGEIISKLRKARWSSEQISYVMKKHSGKKTGLPFEIPVKKILQKFKKSEPERNTNFQRPGFNRFGQGNPNQDNRRNFFQNK